MQSTLKEAGKDDIETIVALLKAMSDELQEFELDTDVTRESVTRSFDEGVNWFLFADENDHPFGICYLQSVHNYWRAERRFYLGGFFIEPDHRGQGRFRDINAQLKKWATVRGGTQIYAHIHKDNEKSLKTFESAGLKADDYLLCVHHWEG